MKPRLKIKGKKSGIVGSAISNFWSYVIFIFVVIIFFVFFQFQEGEIKKNSIVSLELGLNKDLYAINYLRIPMEIETEPGKIFISQDTNFADFIVQNRLLLEVGEGDDTITKEIKDALETNIVGNKWYHRLLFYAAEIAEDDPTDDTTDFCLYDSSGPNDCVSRQVIDPTDPSLFYRDEGVAIVPFPAGIETFFRAGTALRYLKLVFQTANRDEHVPGRERRGDFDSEDICKSLQ